MGSIIRNGVDFKGVPKESKNITYDNTESGLAAVTVQQALDLLSEKITYGTTDIGEGATLTTGTIYCVYEE